MQRLILAAGTMLAVLSGCGKTQQISTRPLPEPIMSTRGAAPKYVAPTDVPQPNPTHSATKSAKLKLNERELTPPGGIQRERWNVIVVHHTANSNDTPQSIDNYHRNVRKWNNGMGYHFLIGNGVNTTDGKIYVGSRWKRQISGAHCKSSSGRYFGTWRKNNYFNTHGIGICLVGNFENTQPTARQLQALEQLTRYLCAESGINPAHIYGHGEVTHKTACPGKYLSRRLAQIKAAVAQALAVDLDPSLPPGWPPGCDDQFSASQNSDFDRARSIAHAGIERGYVAYRSLCHAFDYVADIYRSLLCGAILHHIDHEHAGNAIVDPHALAQFGG